MDTKKLRQKILDLAIHGKLVPQDPNDEPASVLLERIRAEKEALIKEGKIKRSKKSASSDTPHYENVPFEVPEGWCWCRLEEVADYGKCQTTSIEDIEDDSWILELEDIEKDSGRVLKRCTKADREIKGVRHSFCKGNVLYSKLRTYLNKVLIANEAGFCTTEIMPIECGSCLHPAYLCHVLRSKYFLDYTAQCGYGVKMPRLSTTDACKAMIPVAPIEEQKRIAVMIENLDLLIDLLDENKQILESGILQAKSKILDLAIHGKLVPQDPTDEPASELLKRISPKAVASCDNPHYGTLPRNWIWANLGQLFIIVSAKRVTKDQWKTNGVPFYRTREIVQLSLNGCVDNDLFIDEEHYSILKRKYGIPMPNDIMLTAVGTIGKTYVVSENDRFYYKDASVLCLKNCHNINPQYITLAFGSPLVKNQLFEKSKGTTVDTITIEKANNYIVPVPPIEEQSRIVSKVNELFSQLNMIEESLQA